MLQVFCGIAAIGGHMASVFLNFRGGKGVATGAGVLLALVPKVCSIVFPIWLGVALLSRYISLASVIAALLTLPIYLFIEKEKEMLDKVVIAAFLGLLAVAVFIRHLSNMVRIVKKTEPKIFLKAPK